MGGGQIHPRPTVHGQPSSTVKNAKSQRKICLPKKEIPVLRMKFQIFAQTETGHGRWPARRQEVQGHAPRGGRTDIGQVAPQRRPKRWGREENVCGHPLASHVSRTPSLRQKRKAQRQRTYPPSGTQCSTGRQVQGRRRASPRHPIRAPKRPPDIHTPATHDVVKRRTPRRERQDARKKPKKPTK
jgi:hypothetical protein